MTEAHTSFNITTNGDVMSTADIFNAIESTGVLFDVRREKLFTQSGAEVKARDALINVNTGAPVAIVSERYRVASNREIISNVLEAIDVAKLDTRDAFIDVKSAAGGAKSIITIGLPAYSVLADNANNKTVLSITSLNSYNGSTRFVMKAGGVRVACLNGQIMGKIMGAYSEYHSTKLNVVNASRSILKSVSDFQKSEEWFLGLMQTPVTEEDVVAVICATLNIKTDDYLESRVAANLRNTAEGYLVEMGRNAYALYNAVTDYVSHRKVNKDTRAAVFIRDEMRVNKMIEKMPIFIG